MRIKRLHSWNVPPKEAILIQRRLRKKLKIKPLQKIPRLIAGADASFKEDEAIGALAIMTFPQLEIVERIIRKKKLIFPYIPTLLTFREGPVLCECFRAARNTPDLIIFDGQGITHPRGMGLASHLGILLGKPTIGCAKSRLCGECRNPGHKKGDFCYIKNKSGEKIGAVLRTREGVKPVFISPGHMIDIKDSIDVIVRCSKKYRLPEPVRAADALSKNKKYL